MEHENITVVNVEYRCSLCGVLMDVIEGAHDGCRYCATGEEHFHVRCARCSPPGWVAVVLTGELPS